MITHKCTPLGTCYVATCVDVKIDFVVKCSGADCDNGSVYTTEGYGFLCLPRDITQRLAEQNYKFKDADAWLDLWCHTVYQDPRNAFTYKAPAVQYGQYGAALTLENLGRRWGWVLACFCKRINNDRGRLQLVFQPDVLD